MREWVVIILMAIGTITMLLASIGLLRMPDLFARMQTTTKAITLGVGATLQGTAIYFGSLEVVTRAVLIVGFIFITAPIAAHMVARAAYFAGVPIWEEAISGDDQQEEGAQLAEHQPAAEPREEP